jgi:hypothetical protein
MSLRTFKGVRMMSPKVECKSCGHIEEKKNMAECDQICKDCCPIEQGEVMGCDDCTKKEVLEDD